MRHIILYISIVIGITARGNERLELSHMQCRQMAIEASEDVKRAENDVEASQLERAVAKTNYLPNLSGNATAIYNPSNYEVMDGVDLIVKGTYMAGLSLSQPIYAGGRIKAGNELAKIGQSASEEQLKMTQMDAISDADNAYWTYIAVLQKVKMVESYMAQMDTLYEFMDMRRSQGLMTQTDLLRIEAKKSEIEYQLQKCQNGVDLCRMALCRIIGVESDIDIVPTDTIITVSQLQEYDYSIIDRPEYKLLCLNVDASRHKVNLVRGEFLPTVGLQLGFNHYGNIRIKGQFEMQGGMAIPVKENLSNSNFMAMLGVQIPLFHWGEGIKKVKKARIEVTNAELEFEKNVRLLDLQVKQAISNLSSGYAMTRTAAIALNQAEANLEAVRERFSVNMVTLTDVLDAESQWQQSYSNDIEARAQYRIYLSDYRRATGTLSLLSDVD